MKINQEAVDKIIELYIQNVTIKGIADKLGLCEHGVRKKIQKLKKQGLLPNERRNLHCNANNAIMKNQFVEMRKPKVPEVWNEKPVCCNRNVSLKCVYGTGVMSANLCDFLLKTGHSRGCHWKECHRFIAKTKRRINNDIDHKY